MPTQFHQFQMSQPMKEQRVQPSRLIACVVVTAFLMLFMGVLTPSVEAAPRKKAEPANQISSASTDITTPAMLGDVQIIGADPASQTVADIQALVASLVKASNGHNLEEVLKHYSSRFTSGDNLTLKEVKKLILETWKTFPDIQYKSKMMEIRISGDWATVESIDTASATAKVDPIISDTAGRLNSRSRGLLYLHRTRDTWEIMSDYTLFEMAAITYGAVGPLEYGLSAPEQTFAGENYSAKLSLTIPKGLLAIATISQEPLVYPQLKPRDRFRSMSFDRESLERIFQANDTNNNEIVTATVGLTQIGQDEEDRPTIKLGGLVTIVKRVNVIPKSTFKASNGKNSLVKTSADGKIDLSKMGDDTAGPENAQSEAEMSPGEVSPEDMAPESIPEEDTAPSEQPD
ncbi:MAG: hypothetical protein VKJ04_03195 [Vampirovibrionales bacterium]|nr:hypothetical protein [Vampirovibrionales bacterium]